MTPSPIRRVLSILRAQGVRFLLMGGQACVFYGAAEFSRDTDIVADRRYWEPLKKDLERLRHCSQQTKKPSRDEK